jgi:hypothetical protein
MPEDATAEHGVRRRFAEKKSIHSAIFGAYIAYGYAIYRLVAEPSNLLLVVSFLTLLVGYILGVQITHLSGAFKND